MGPFSGAKASGSDSEAETETDGEDGGARCWCCLCAMFALVLATADSRMGMGAAGQDGVSDSAGERRTASVIRRAGRGSRSLGLALRAKRSASGNLGSLCIWMAAGAFCRREGQISPERVGTKAKLTTVGFVARRGQWERTAS